MKRLWFFALVNVLSLILVFTSCRKSQSKERPGLSEAETQQKFVTFAATHNAIADWKAGLPDQQLDMAYSIQAENALVPPDKRPVAFRAFLDDIVRRDGHILLEFSAPDNLFLTLETAPETLQQILKESPSNVFKEYAVVAEVESVQKPKFEVTADKMDGGSDVRLQRSSDFEAKGQCIALMNLSDQ